MNPIINGGGPAFPCESYGLKNGKETTVPSQGMTLRDYFAGKALIALPHRGCGADLDDHDTAIAAYQMADAMIAAREVKP